MHDFALNLKNIHPELPLNAIAPSAASRRQLVCFCIPARMILNEYRICCGIHIPPRPPCFLLIPLVRVSGSA
jgi:hypothetical protein